MTYESGNKMALHDVDLTTGKSAFERRSIVPDVGRTSGFYARFGKRVFDLILCAFMLPVLIPVMVGIWLWIRLDGGAALFCQPRVGRGAAVFSCYKFRTMVPDAERVLEEMCAAEPALAIEWTTHQKLRDDPRITRIGRILRKTSLDELPQIINVLKGEMSLVGPRPFMPSQQSIYDDAGGTTYYRVKPGVTGLWQVISRHDTTFASRVRFDEAYGADVSLMGGCSLILQTVKVVLNRTGA